MILRFATSINFALFVIGVNAVVILSITPSVSKSVSFDPARVSMIFISLAKPVMVNSLWISSLGLVLPVLPLSQAVNARIKAKNRAEIKKFLLICSER